jgi:Zn-dependent peptidase ImmA (M78 family)
LNPPEALLARRLIEKLDLSPPIDIKSLVERYAELVFAKIPEPNVDGICLNLKVPGKSPKVIVNSANPSTRKRFTLAHELGHILIPWHLGSIIDNVDLSDSSPSNSYWGMEKEANSFAAELLMPHVWVDQLLDDEEDLAAAHKAIAEDCGVSGLAAAIRMSSFLELGVVYAAEQNGVIQYSGKSEGTVAPSLPWGHLFDSESYAYASDHKIVKYGDAKLHWWVLPSEISIDVADVRSWREILNKILSDICSSDQAAGKLKQSVNGVAAFANSTAKRSQKYSPDSVASACIQRFKDRDEYKEFTDHPDFEAYVQKRSKAFFS